jgi:hypothetical protein
VKLDDGGRKRLDAMKKALAAGLPPSVVFLDGDSP